MGIASAAVSGLGAISGYQSAQQQAAAQNRASIRNYKYQLKVRKNNWMRTTSDWENDKISYGETVAENSFAAQEGYARAQRQLNELFKSAAFEEQGDMVKLLQSTGQMAASGRTGKTAQRIDDSIIAAFGRNNATRAATLASGKERYQQNVEDIRREMISANEQAFAQVAFAPIPDVAPPKPVMQQGPSALSLAAGLGGAALSGYQTYNELKAPSAGDWGGFGEPTPSLNTSLKIGGPIGWNSNGYDWASQTSRLN